MNICQKIFTPIVGALFTISESDNGLERNVDGNENDGTFQKVREAELTLPPEPAADSGAPLANIR